MAPVSPKAPIGRRENAVARRLIAAIQAMNLHVIDGDTDPRVLDLQLAEALKFARPRAIRQLIERYREELERYGPLHFRRAMVEIGSGALREVFEYWLNEHQVILICWIHFSATPAGASEQAAPARAQRA
jgi:hypothetical protein